MSERADAAAALWEPWSRFLAGAPITADEEKRLVEALEADPELQRIALEDEAFHGALRELGHRQVALEAFAARIEPLVAAERDGAAFAARIERRITREGLSIRLRRACALGLGAALASMAAVVLWVQRPMGDRAAAPALGGRAQRLTTVAPSTKTPSAGVQSGVAAPAVGLPRATPAEQPPLGEVVYRFERRETPKLVGREVGRCPPRPGSDARRCLVGVVNSERLHSLSVRIGDNDGLFRHAHGLVLIFDYWIGAWVGDRAPRFEVSLRVRGQPRTDYRVYIEDPAPARWQTAVIPLDELRVTKPTVGQDRLRPGDPIVLIKLVTDSTRQDVLYVDNLRLVAR